MKKILLVNQGHTDNIGDQLISEITNRNLSKYFKTEVEKFIPDESEKRIILTADSLTTGENRKNKKKCCQGIKKIIKKNYLICLEILTLKYYRKIVKSINDEYDAIFIGGGELLADYVAFTAALQAWLLYAYKANTKIILYGVSGFVFEKRKHRALKMLLNNCELICVRDYETQHHLSRQLNKKIMCAPDIVFLLNNINSAQIAQKCAKEDIFVSIYSSEELGISERISEYYDGWIRLILDKINLNTEKLLIGYTTQSDYYAAKEFYSYVSKKTRFKNIEIKLCDYSDWRGYCNVISKCKYVITGRMHAMIIALQYGCEVIPYLVKKKIEVFNSEYIEKKYDMFSVNEKILLSLEEVKNRIDT